MRRHGLTLPYRKTLDVLTLAYTPKFTDKHGPARAKSLAREVAEELLRPALSDSARAELDAMEAKRLVTPSIARTTIRHGYCR
jgi:hypothetical protein